MDECEELILGYLSYIMKDVDDFGYLPLDISRN
jgi:hypothetical protein